MTKIIFGKGTEDSVGQEVKKYGSRVLLHYGGGTIKKIGLYDKVINILKKENIKVIELAGVRPNPRLGMVKEGIELCRKEDIDLIQELFGYILHKDYSIEKAIMLYGKGRNGKGQFLELIKNFVGKDNLSAVSLQRLADENSFNIHELHTKLVNVGGDISDSYLSETGMFKSLTGNDIIRSSRVFIYFTQLCECREGSLMSFLFSSSSLPNPII